MFIPTIKKGFQTIATIPNASRFDDICSRRMIFTDLKREEFKHFIWPYWATLRLLKTSLLVFSLTKDFFNAKHILVSVITAYFRFTALLWKYDVSLQQRSVLLKIFIHPKKNIGKIIFPTPFFNSTKVVPGSSAALNLIRYYFSFLVR